MVIPTKFPRDEVRATADAAVDDVVTPPFHLGLIPRARNPFNFGS